jgi:hypothetical protein
MRLPKLLRRCRCFHYVYAPSVMARAPLTSCPKHGDDPNALPTVDDWLRVSGEGRAVPAQAAIRGRDDTPTDERY